MRITLNPDEEIVKTIREGLRRTGGYCPCRRERKEEYRCICDEFKAQIRDPEFEGYCHCMLYCKEKETDPECQPEEDSVFSDHSPQPFSDGYVSSVKSTGAGSASLPDRNSSIISSMPEKF